MNTKTHDKTANAHSKGDAALRVLHPVDAGVMCRVMRPLIRMAVICLAISTTVAAASEKKIRIEAEAVELVEVVRHNDATVRRLGPNEITEFVSAWNDAKPIGLCKYLVEHRFLVHLKDGRTLEYRTNSATIKSNGDYCYSVGQGPV